MEIIQNKGIRYSQYVVDSVNEFFSSYDEYNATVETFYNCREQGYVLRVHRKDNYEKSLCIWICAQRNSDNPMIVWEQTTMPKEEANMFNSESYHKRCEVFETVDGASDYVTNLISTKLWEPYDDEDCE